MAPLCHAFRKAADDFETVICVTGQHREMLDQVLSVFQIEPDIDLNIMKENQDLTDVTTSILSGMRNIFAEYRPDVVLVHGDTTTTLATAMAAFYADVPVAHIEAGLRTNNIQVPFPEEFNRQIVSKVAKWHFPPTELNRANLLREHCLDENIEITGNTVVDALFWILRKFEEDENRLKNVTDCLSRKLPFNWKESQYILITGHRREQFGEGLVNICKALSTLADKFSKVHFVYPVHLNPNVQKPVHSMLSKRKNVHLIAPLDYEPFVCLLKHCFLVLTDSGGIQEEAPSLAKPVLVMRDVTERPEAIEAGTVKLVGTNIAVIVNTVSELIETESSYMAMSHAHNPYGDGRACERITDVIKKAFHEK